MNLLQYSSLFPNPKGKNGMCCNPVLNNHDEGNFKPNSHVKNVANVNDFIVNIDCFVQMFCTRKATHK